MEPRSYKARITCKRSRPNPLFQDWLEELYEESKAKKSKLESMLGEALTSLSKYPLPLETGAECGILKGFNKTLCKFVDKKLEVYNSINSQPEVQPSSSASLEINKNKTTHSPENVKIYDNDNFEEPKISNSQTSHASSESNKNSRSHNPYKPRFRSGGYAILIALLGNMKENPNNPGLIKEHLIDKAQPLCEESFIRPKPESFYTAWSSMSMLIKKDLVTKVSGKKVKYSLTDQGISIAMDLFAEMKIRPTMNDIIFKETSNNCNARIEVQPLVDISVPDDTESLTGVLSKSNPGLISNTEVDKQNPKGKAKKHKIESESSGDVIDIDTLGQPLSQRSTTSVESFLDFEPGSFNIILLIDKNETGGVTKKNDPTVAQFNKYTDLKHEYRSLKVGDFAWIAQHKINKDQELVLPFIVERKRMDDLGASIKDGRFHEQKFRLRKCGLQTVIYLAENFGSNKHVGLPIQALNQALVNTCIQDGFKVHITDSLTESVKFLAMMTARLKYEYKDKPLNGANREPEGTKLMTFSFFNKSSSKSKPLTVRETFIKLLVQLKGCSVEKALSITEVYSTPRLLMKAYEHCNNKKQCETLLANLKYENGKNVGPSVSKSIYHLFNSQYSVD